MDIIKQWAVIGLIKSGRYSADKEGNIYSHRPGPPWTRRPVAKRSLEPSALPSGYIQRQFSLEHGAILSCYQHVFVWLFFYGVYRPGYEIDHIDNNPGNNALGNLRLISHLENHRRKSEPIWLIEQNKKRGSEGTSRPRVPKHIRIKIIEDFQSTKISRQKLAAKYGFSRQTIASIVNTIPPRGEVPHP